MKCLFCGHNFTIDEALKSCKGCPIRKCDMMKCPNCGYEILPEPKLIKLLKRRRKNENKRGNSRGT